MKTKIALLFFGLSIFFQNCRDSNQDLKASKDQLQLFLSSNKDFQLFIDAHLNNLTSLSSLSDSESKLANELIKKVTANENLIENGSKLYSLSKMEINTLVFFKNFKDQLDLNYVYEEKDLVEVIQNSLQDKISKSRKVCGKSSSNGFS
jgi:hypothetical protein